MAYILMQQGEDAFIRTTLAGVAASPAIPNPGGNWGLAMATTAVGSNTAANKERVMSTTSGTGKIQEIGQSVAGGYARAPIVRSAVGWPNPTGHPGASYSSTSPQQSFSFTGAPTANGAASWWLCKGTTGISVGSDDLMFGADLAAIRNFAAGDTENITISYQQT